MRVCAIKKPKIAIIGAGLSGLTIGYRLNQKGYDVAVYEARPRVGGRIHTVYVKNLEGAYSLAELGGQNITDGGEAKHFLNLANELGLKIEEDYRCLSRGFYDAGKVYDSNELLKTYGFSQFQFEQALNTLPASVYSIADVIKHLFQNNEILKRIFNFYMGAYEGLPPQDLAITQNIETLKYFLPGGGGASQERTEAAKPFLLKYIKGGNIKLPLALSHALENNVFLNKALQKVSQHAEGIMLEFKDGTNTVCDKLILSIPCSTFKNISWGNSLISSEKLDRMSTVQYGLNGKVIIPIGSVNANSGHSLVNDDHVGTFHNNDYKLLILYTDGIWGKGLNKDLREYYSAMIEMVKAAYGKMQNQPQFPTTVSEENYKKYDGFIVKSWAEDVYAKGSYSVAGTMLGNEFLKQTIYNNIRVKSMFLPIDDRVFFVGEHTSIIPEGGTMEAAVESAERLSQSF